MTIQKPAKENAINGGDSRSLLILCTLVMHQLTRIHKFCNPHLEDSVHHIPGWHLEEETLVENWIVVTGIYIWNVLELNNFSKDTWMCLRLDTPAAHFSHQGTNKWKGTFCKSFQSKGIILDRFLVHIFRIMGLCNSFGMRATVSRFQILTSLLFLGMFFMLRIRTAKHSLVLSYLVKETQIFNLSEWPDVFTKKWLQKRDSTLCSL